MTTPPDSSAPTSPAVPAAPPEAGTASPRTADPRAVNPMAVHGVLIAIQAIFGGFHVVARAVLGEVDSLTLVGLRVLLATPLLVAWALAVDRERPTLRDLPHLALCGLLGVFGNQILFLTGLSYTTAGSASILMTLIPVFTAGIGALLGIEKVGGRRLAGIALAVAGAVVLLNPADLLQGLSGGPHSGGPHSGGPGATFGNLLVLANVVCYSGFLVAQRPLLQRLPWRTVIAGSFFFGTLGILPVSLPSIVALDFAAQPAGVWWGLAYIVIFPTFLAYALNSWALHHTRPSLVAIYTTLQPLFSNVLACFFLGERLGAPQAAGFVLTTAGLWLTAWRVGRRQR